MVFILVFLIGAMFAVADWNTGFVIMVAACLGGMAWELCKAAYGRRQ